MKASKVTNIFFDQDKIEVKRKENWKASTHPKSMRWTATAPISIWTTLDNGEDHEILDAIKSWGKTKEDAYRNLTWSMLRKSKDLLLK